MVGAAALVIVAGLYVDYRLSRGRLLADLTASATRSIDGTLLRLDELRLGVEGVVRLVSEAVHERPSAERAEELLRSLVQSNEHVHAASLALASPEGTPLAGYYVYRDGREGPLPRGDRASVSDASPDFKGFDLVRKEGVAQWIGPYPSEPVGDEMLSRFSAPLRDDSGAFIAAIAADVSLDSLAPYLDDLAIDARGFGFLLTATGVVIGAPLGEVLALPLTDLYPALADLIPRIRVSRLFRPGCPVPGIQESANSAFDPPDRVPGRWASSTPPTTFSNPCTTTPGAYLSSACSCLVFSRSSSPC